MADHYVPHAVTIVFPDDESMVFDTFDDFNVWATMPENINQDLKAVYLTYELQLPICKNVTLKRIEREEP